MTIDVRKVGIFTIVLLLGVLLAVAFLAEPFFRRVIDDRPETAMVLGLVRTCPGVQKHFGNIQSVVFVREGSQVTLSPPPLSGWCRFTIQGDKTGVVAVDWERRDMNQPVKLLRVDLYVDWKQPVQIWPEPIN